MKPNWTYHYKITLSDRNRLNRHPSLFILFTGLSGSGKSTLADALEQKLFGEGYRTYVLDGDNIRKSYCNDLGYTASDRAENVKRVAELGRLMMDAGLIVLAAFIIPYKKDREYIEDVVKPANFVEIFVNTSLEECESRDVKGLYKLARKGEIGNMTGISHPYESPQHPDIEISQSDTLEEAVQKIYEVVIKKLQLKEDE